MSPKTGILAEFASLPWRNAFPPHQNPPPVEPSAWKRRVLPGAWTTLERNSLKEDMLIVKYPLHFSRQMDTLVMVNTPHWVRVWADGKLLFARDEGEMAPSFHRVPIHQMAPAAFSAGDHELIVAMMPAPDAPKIEWVAALAEQPEEGRLYENWLVRDGFVRAEPEA